MPEKRPSMTCECGNILPASTYETECCAKCNASHQASHPEDPQTSSELESLALSALEEMSSNPTGEVVLASRFTKLEDKYKEAFCPHCHEKNFLIDVNCKYCGGDLDAEMRSGKTLEADRKHEDGSGWWNPWMILGASIFLLGGALLLTAAQKNQDLSYLSFGFIVVGLVIFNLAGGEVGHAD